MEQPEAADGGAALDEELLELYMAEELYGVPPLPPLDLGAPPGLEELLKGLCPRLGGWGLSKETLRGLRKAGEGLRGRREAWLRWESLERGLRELLRDPRGLPHGVREELERALASAQLRLGGLPHGHPPAAPPALAAGVLPWLERRLGEKVGELGSFCLGEPPRGGVAEELEAQGLRLSRARGQRRLLGDHLQRLGGAYLQAVGRCGAALGGAVGLCGARGGQERRRGLFLEARGAATLLKARQEELKLLLETYPSPTLRAHRRIRLRLEEEWEEAEREAGLARAQEEAVTSLGPAYSALAREYGRLRHLIGQRRWALAELRPHAQ